jgi:hypothetical protein
MKRFFKRIYYTFLKISPKPGIIRKVKNKNLTYLDNIALYEAFKTVEYIEKNHIPGVMIECGCALGGSSIVLARAKKTERIFNVYDVFGMIPEPGNKDDKAVHERYKTIETGKSQGINGELYYGYQENLYDKVTKTFSDFGLNITENNINLIKGLYQDTLKMNSPVALAHIDCDWYDSVMLCLKEITPRLSKKGILIIDDYNVWGGCRKAVNEYFKERKDEFTFLHKSRLHIIKK